MTDLDVSPAGAQPLRRLKKLQHVRAKSLANSNEAEEQEEEKESGDGDGDGDGDESVQASPTSPPPRVNKRARQQQKQQAPHGARSKRRMDARMFLDDEAEYVS